MESFSEIIDAFGGPARFAEAIGVSANHAGVMKSRGAIPPEYWTAVVDAASARSIEGITYEKLAEIAAKKRRPAEAQIAGVA